MHETLMFCGTKSGRDLDKFAACGLKTRTGRLLISPAIDMPGRHYECRIVYKTAMEPGPLAPDYEHLYPGKDYHTLYFGEIQACYET